MKQKLAAGIVRHRIVILILMALLAVFCLTTIGKTRINYDLTSYLNENTMTRQALQVMQAEFGSNEQVLVMFQDLDAETLDGTIETLNDLPGVLLASHDPEDGVRTVNGVTYQLVTVAVGDCDVNALVEDLRGMSPEAGHCAVGGSAASMLDIQENVAAEIPVVMLIAVAVVVLVLLLTSHAWLEPVVILIALAISIVINMGTNFVFPSISFITFAVCAILQLALSIDYAIILLHTYNSFCDDGLSPTEAMEKALARSMMPISSSAFTTVAGLLSLLFMSFTIGFDIGMVLSKGILISLLSVFLLMPAVTLIFQKPLKRTRHKPIQLGGDHLARGIYRLRRPVAILLVLAAAVGCFLQSRNTYTFTDVGQTARKGQAQEITKVFGASTPLALMVPGGDEDEDYDMQRELVNRLMTIEIDGTPAVRDIAAMVTTGAEALKYYTAAEAAELAGVSRITVTLFYAAKGFGSSVRADKLLEAAGALAADSETLQELREALSDAQAAFNGPHYARMMLEMNFTVLADEMPAAIESILEEARAVYGGDCYLTGVPMSTYDISHAFHSDLMKVNLITFLAILLIVALSFRAFLLPLMLVFVIEGAIWISMGISRLMNQPIFFMCYLICVSIQMGATIDYGILVCDQYRTLRGEGLPIPGALSAALHKALPTVLTSGTILMTAGFIIGKICSVYYISSIGLLLARGTLISVFLVLTLLPALLSLFDRIVVAGKGGSASLN